MPRPDDIFQERLYCIQWIERDTLGSHRPKTFFAAPTEEDLEREHKVDAMVTLRPGVSDPPALLLETGARPAFEGQGRHGP
jgi:putative DNA methylase